MLSILMGSVDMMADGVRWGRPTVDFTQKNKKKKKKYKGEATFTVRMQGRKGRVKSFFLLCFSSLLFDSLLNL